MADTTLHPAPALGTDLVIGSNRITGRDDLALFSVAIPLGGDEALAKALQDGWSLAIPGPVHTTERGGLRAIRTAPDQIMLVLAPSTPDAAARLRAGLSGVGYLTVQTDAWVALEISGPDTLAALERLCPLDLPRLEPGASARSVIHHMGAMILRLERDRFLLFSAGSSAASFLAAIEATYAGVAKPRPG